MASNISIRQFILGLLTRQPMSGYGTLDLVQDTLETVVSGDSFIGGSNFSAADVYVGSQIGWGLQFGTLEKRPAFEAYWARVSDRDAYRRANDIDNALMPEAG